MDSAGSVSDYARGYQIAVSTDGVTWQQVATGTGTNALISANVGTRTANFVRVTQTGSASSWWSIAEFNLFT
jgi:beta-glucosidase